MSKPNLLPANQIQEEQANSLMLQNMSQEDAQEYMKMLNETGGTELTGLERKIFVGMQYFAQRRDAIMKQLEATNQRLEQLKIEINQVVGQMNANAFMLQKAQDDRLAPPEPSKKAKK